MSPVVVENVASATFSTRREQAAELRRRHSILCVMCGGRGWNEVDNGEWDEESHSWYPRREQEQCYYCEGSGSAGIDDPFIAATLAALESEPEDEPPTT